MHKPYVIVYNTPIILDSDTNKVSEFFKGQGSILMNEDFFKSLSGIADIKAGDLMAYSPLVLAYVGDSVYELYIRTYMVSKGNAPVHKLHKRSIDFVKAKAQSETIHRLMDILEDEEKDIVRRGRNAKSGTIPKNADVVEYKHATGFETLLGFLYLKKDFQRLLQLLEASMVVGKEI